MVQTQSQTTVSNMFPPNTYYLKREWLRAGQLPGLKESGMYYIARCEEGEMCAVFSNAQEAFIHTKQYADVSALLWAH